MKTIMESRGQVERDVFEVVLARTPDDQLVSHYFPFATYSLDTQTQHSTDLDHTLPGSTDRTHTEEAGEVCAGRCWVTVVAQESRETHARSNRCS